MDPSKRVDILRHVFEPTTAEVCWDLSHPKCVDADTGVAAESIPPFRRILTLPCFFALRYVEKDTSVSTRAVYYAPSRAASLRDPAAHLMDGWCLDGRTPQQLQRILGIEASEQQEMEAEADSDMLELHRRHPTLAALSNYMLKQILQALLERILPVRLPLTRQIIGVAMYGRRLLATATQDLDANALPFVNCMSGYKLQVYTTREVPVGIQIVLQDEGVVDFATQQQAATVDVVAMWESRPLATSAAPEASVRMLALLRQLVTASDGDGAAVGGVIASQEALARALNRSSVKVTQAVHTWMKQWWTRWRLQGTAADVPWHQFLLTCAALQLWDPVNKRMASDERWFVDLMEAWNQVYGTSTASDVLFITLIGTEAWLNNTKYDSAWYRTLARCMYMKP